MADLTNKFQKLKREKEELRKMQRIAQDVNMVEKAKDFWKSRAEKADRALKTTQLLLAGLVHRVGGCVSIPASLMEEADSGAFTMNFTPQKNGILIEVTRKPEEPDEVEDEDQV